MNRKLFLAILLIVATSLFSRVIANDAGGTRVNLQVHYIDPQKTDRPMPRTSPYMELQGCTLMFSPFQEQCVLEITNIEDESIIYNTVVLTGETSCQIPILPEGVYLVKFTHENVVYWGYLEIDII